MEGIFRFEHNKNKLDLKGKKGKRMVHNIYDKVRAVMAKKTVFSNICWHIVTCGSLAIEDSLMLLIDKQKLKFDATGIASLMKMFAPFLDHCIQPATIVNGSIHKRRSSE